eukprot:1945959-Pleurochrysis_carterae.AAC.1
MPDTHANGSITGLKDWYAAVSVQPPDEVAWASVTHVKTLPRADLRVSYRHECEMRDPRMQGCDTAGEVLPWRSRALRDIWTRPGDAGLEHLAPPERT